MNISKSERREKKRNKKKNGMRVDNKSIFVVQSAIIKRGEKAKGKRK